MQVLRKIQDSKRLIAASEQNKSFWNRLFGKKLEVNDNSG